MITQETAGRVVIDTVLLQHLVDIQNCESDAAYHSDYRNVSASMLKCLDEAPALFEALYITRSQSGDDSPDLKLGRQFHALVLQPERFADLCPMMPDYHLEPANCTANGKNGKRSTSKSTDYYQSRKREFERENAGKDVITPETLKTIKAMAAAVWAHDEARFILESPGENEVKHRWHDVIPRRAMLDAPRPGIRVIADLKTIAGRPTPQAFAMACAKFRWWCQCSYYCDAARDLYGDDEYRFRFIVVGKAEPHEVAIYELDSETPNKFDGLTDREWADRRTGELVAEYVRRMESGNWQAGYQVGVHVSPLPGFVRSRFYDVEE